MSTPFSDLISSPSPGHSLGLSHAGLLCFLNTPSPVLPQGLCTGHSLCFNFLSLDIYATYFSNLLWDSAHLPRPPFKKTNLNPPHTPHSPYSFFPQHLCHHLTPYIYIYIYIYVYIPPGRMWSTHEEGDCVHCHVTRTWTSAHLTVGAQ